MLLRSHLFASQGKQRELFFTYDRGLEVDKDSTRHVLAGSSLKEEGVEGIVMLLGGLLILNLAVGPDVVLQAVQFPARVANLDAALTQVDRDALPLFRKEARTLWQNQHAGCRM